MNVDHSERYPPTTADTISASKTLKPVILFVYFTAWDLGFQNHQNQKPPEPRRFPKKPPELLRKPPEPKSKP